MIFLDYKKNVWVDFYHLQAGCFHTLRPHSSVLGGTSNSRRFDALIGGA